MLGRLLTRYSESVSDTCFGKVVSNTITPRVERCQYAWKTKPICRRRSRVRALSDSDPSSVSPTHTCPDVRSSRPATQCISVDLPDPEGPVVYRLVGNSTVTLSRARTARVARSVHLHGAEGAGGAGGRWRRSNRGGHQRRRYTACHAVSSGNPSAPVLPPAAGPRGVRSSSTTPPTLGRG